MTQQTLTHCGDDAVAMAQEECCKKNQVKCQSQGGQNKRPLEGRVKAPTMTIGPITQQEKMD